MIKVTLITTKGCSHCVQVKKTLEPLKKEYNLQQAHSSQVSIKDAYSRCASYHKSFNINCALR